VVGGHPTAQQLEVMNWVQKAHDESLAAMKPGVPWREIHAKAAQVIAQGLSQLNLIHCSPEEALEREVVSLFFPHGVGHMVGHRVRDVGGNPTKSPDKVFGARLRVNIDLEENHLMTVEPGLYFIRPLLESAEVRSKFKSQVNWSEVERWLDFGGIRFENDVLVKSSGSENLTKEIPQRFF
jgi:Xaa-Pro dipeptidase